MVPSQALSWEVRGTRCGPIRTWYSQGIVTRQNAAKTSLELSMVWAVIVLAVLEWAVLVAHGRARKGEGHVFRGKSREPRFAGGGESRWARPRRHFFDKPRCLLCRL